MGDYGIFVWMDGALDFERAEELLASEFPDRESFTSEEISDRAVEELFEREQPTATGNRADNIITSWQHLKTHGFATKKGVPFTSPLERKVIKTRPDGTDETVNYLMTNLGAVRAEQRRLEEFHEEARKKEREARLEGAERREDREEFTKISQEILRAASERDFATLREIKRNVPKMERFGTKAKNALLRYILEEREAQGIFIPEWEKELLLPPVEREKKYKEERAKFLNIYDLRTVAKGVIKAQHSFTEQEKAELIREKEREESEFAKKSAEEKRAFAEAERKEVETAFEDLSPPEQFVVRKLVSDAGRKKIKMADILVVREERYPERE